MEPKPPTCIALTNKLVSFRIFKVKFTSLFHHKVHNSIILDFPPFHDNLKKCNVFNHQFWLRLSFLKFSILFRISELFMRKFRKIDMGWIRKIVFFLLNNMIKYFNENINFIRPKKWS